MRGDDNDRVGGREYGDSATCSAIARRCWQKLTLAEEVPRSIQKVGADIGLEIELIIGTAEGSEQERL